MVSTRFGFIREIPFGGSNPPPIAMTDTDTLQKIQNHIVEMERCHEEELRKLKADHDQLKARVRRPQGDEHSVHTLLKRTQGESHTRHIVNTQDDLSLSHMHRPVGQTTHRHPLVKCIMEVDIPLGWKPLNLKRYDWTTDLNEHLDDFLTQANLYTNDDVILCHVFPTSLKRAALTW